MDLHYYCATYQEKALEIIDRLPLMKTKHSDVHEWLETVFAETADGSDPSLSFRMDAADELLAPNSEQAFKEMGIREALQRKHACKIGRNVLVAVAEHSHIANPMPTEN